MRRKQSLKPKYLHYHLSLDEVIEMHSYFEVLFTILANRRTIGFNRYQESFLNSAINPMETAFNERVLDESTGIATMDILSKDVTKFKTILRHLQNLVKCHSGEENEKISNLYEMLSR